MKRLLLLSTLLVWQLTFAQDSAPASKPVVQTPQPTPAPEKPNPNVPVVPVVKAVYPHDAGTFTQGLEFYGGKLYQSGGLYRESTIQLLNPTTGDVIVKKPLEPIFFGEGLTVLNDTVYQITWREETAFAYDAKDLSLKQEFTYSGEGWGLANDGTSLIMSNGSDTLTWRNPETFLPIREQKVTFNGRPVAQLNELEYVNGSIYANIFMQDTIVKINPANGEVTQLIDASSLYPATQRSQQQVLNGIAWNPETETFFLTGKNWPKMYEVTF